MFHVMLTCFGFVSDDHAIAYRLGTCFGLNIPEERLEDRFKGMTELNKKTTLKEIYIEDFGQQWTKMQGGHHSAKDINTIRIDELSTEDNDGDIVKVMRKQMEEMTQNMQKQMMEMNAMMKVSRDVMRCGLGPFGTTHNAIVGRVHLHGLPPTPLLPSSDGLHPPQQEIRGSGCLSLLEVGTPTTRSYSEQKLDLDLKEV